MTSESHIDIHDRILCRAQIVRVVVVLNALGVGNTLCTVRTHWRLQRERERALTWPG